MLSYILDYPLTALSVVTLRRLHRWSYEYCKVNGHSWLLSQTLLGATRWANEAPVSNEGANSSFVYHGLHTIKQVETNYYA